MIGNAILLNYDLISDLCKLRDAYESKLQDQEAFLEHQRRDLPGCWPSERGGRITEIEELEKVIIEFKEVIKKLTVIIEASEK